MYFESKLLAVNILTSILLWDSILSRKAAKTNVCFKKKNMLNGVMF